MNDRSKSISEKNNPILAKAAELMKSYALASGAKTLVLDKDWLPLKELYSESLCNNYLCEFCIKHKKDITAKNAGGLLPNPCHELFVNTVRETVNSGKPCTFICDMKLAFWASPVYDKQRLIGVLLGGVIRQTDNTKTLAKLQEICGDELPARELKYRLNTIPRGDEKRIKALAELMLVCTEFLSGGSGDLHSVKRRRSLQQAMLTVKVADLKSKNLDAAAANEYARNAELKLFMALKKGDVKGARESLSDLLAVYVFENPNQFGNVQYKAIELAILVLQAGDGTAFCSEIIPEKCYKYLEALQVSVNIEELADVLYRIVDDKAYQFFAFQDTRHVSALKKAERHIYENFSRKISLKEIADVAGFSAPYFSTIFREEMGVNFSSYLNQLRVKNASYLLTNTNLSLSNITQSCGFEDQSWFSKIFKTYTGVSPRKYRDQGGLNKISPIEFSEEYRKIIEAETPAN